MLKKYIKVIENLIAVGKSGVCANKCPINAEFNGKYLYADGYHCVIVDEKLDIPTQNGAVYTIGKSVEEFSEISEILIPYNAVQIRKFAKQREPFYLGVSTGGIIHCTSVGINPTFLADAMETTKSNAVKISDKCHMVIEGNGFKWFIMPIMRQTLRQEMTVIEEN